MASELPEQCEVTGCQSVYCGTNRSGVEVRKRGKADVFVNVNGLLRGVCCKCYVEVTQREGTGVMVELKSPDGTFDLTKLKDHWQSIGQEKLDVHRKGDTP